MAWNPEVYNQFKSERAAPFHDLLALLHVRSGLDVVDLGCGTGELTRKVAEMLPEANVLGVDSSAEMLHNSLETVQSALYFERTSIEDQLEKPKQWDVVFSNAALQWVPHHEVLFPKIVSLIKPEGQLLVQMPAQHHNKTNQLLHELAARAPYAQVFEGWDRKSPVLEINHYAEMLFESKARSMQVFEKIYPLVLADSDALLSWVSGTALIPYLERLPELLKSEFVEDYKQLLKAHFPKNPVFYPFKRILIEAKFRGGDKRLSRHRDQ